MIARSTEEPHEPIPAARRYARGHPDMNRRGWLFAMVLVICAAAGRSAAASADGSLAIETPNRFQDVFEPFATDHAALSPDGRYVAYSLREATEMSVVVVPIDRPERATAKVAVTSDERMKGKAPTKFETEGPPANLQWLSWVAPDRVVLQTMWDLTPVLIAFDANGGNARVLATARTTETLRSSGTIVDHGAIDAETVLVRARELQPRFTSLGHTLRWDYYRLNVRTGKFRQIDEGTMERERETVRARRKAAHALWPAVEAELAAELPGRRIELIENDQTQNRFLARVQGVADAGAFYVYDRSQRRAYEMVRRSPRLDAARVHRTESFDFTTKDGASCRGVVTMPRSARVSPVPLVVILPEHRGRRLTYTFSREVQALADMGLATVLYDDVPAAPGMAPGTIERGQIEHLLQVVEALARLHPVSVKRVALYGEREGGYLALRALQAASDRFRGAVAVQPAVTLEKWNDRTRWPKVDARTGKAPAMGKPVCVAANFGRIAGRRGDESDAVRYIETAEARAGGSVEVHVQPYDFRLRLPKARAAAFRDIERFLFASIYDYEVRVGDPQVADPSSQ